jgi:hypothetical protein
MAALLVSALVLACGSDDDNGAARGQANAGDGGQGGTPGGIVGGGDASVSSGQAGGDAAVSSGQAGDAGTTSGTATPGGSGANDAGGQTPSTDAGGGQMGATADAGSTQDGGTTSPPNTPATGPVNGDPTKPVVVAEGVPCRMGSAAGGLGSPNAMVGGRDLIVDYPCGKHEGAHMTVILNLHGTLIGGAPWQYQRGYFSAYRFVDSHNLIVVHPHSVSMASSGAQWGNMDNGQDLPHLLAVLDWVYKSFAKFQLRGLWIGGHSWGAGFATGRLGGGPLVCHPMLKDKVKGGIGMSRLSVPACASSISLIATRGQEENIPLVDQSRPAMEHGCMAPVKGPVMVGNNERFYFEGCKGFVHEDYHMLGKGHIDNMDQEVVKSIVDAIKSTEK